MKSFMDYVIEEIEEDKQIRKRFEDGRETDFAYYHDMHFVLLLVMFAATLEGAIVALFFDVSFWESVINAVVFAIGVCAILLHTIHEWKNERYYTVIDDSTTCRSESGVVANIPRGTVIVLQKENMYANGMAVFYFEGRKAYINTKKLNDVTMYKKK